MRIIARSKICAYYAIHADSKIALEEWFVKTKKSDWKCFEDIKKTFNSVDYVGNQHYVFNIKGKNYRLVVAVKFTPKLVFIRFVGTHDEYMKIDVSNI